MRVVLERVERLAEGIWRASLPPDELRLLGSASVSTGARSVILLVEPTYDAAQQSLAFDHTTATPLNAGFSAEAIMIAAGNGQHVVSGSTAKAGSAATPVAYGPGDRAFLGELDSLPGSMQIAGKRLLEIIRRQSPGDLKRGQRRNFSNTPDNFWYAVIQPQARTLSVTVRGRPSEHGPTSFELKDDRPGFTRFKVTDPSEVDEAVRIIFASRRRSPKE